MSDRENLGRDNRSHSDRDTTGHREKSTVDKLIDRAQEKGVFDKAERLIKDRISGKGKRR